MTQTGPFRLPSGGRLIDRAYQLPFRFDGRQLRGVGLIAAFGQRGLVQRADAGHGQQAILLRWSGIRGLPPMLAGGIVIAADTVAAAMFGGI